MIAQQMPERIERWSWGELTLRGPAEGNPFLDVQLQAEFRHRNRFLHVDGFYDGEGLYRLRFMPDELGEWHYVTRSNHPALDGIRGQLTCTPPSPGNHGPVRVANTYHFAYADGTPYIQIGTTCYAWAHQGDALEERTLATLAASPFNKLRMCVFPKDYLYNKNEPIYYPFVRSAAGGSDFTRFCPAFFRHFERRVAQLLALGIEADIILFHPYDRWGYATMDAASDDRYLRYVIARLAAYRNVWWSLANEFDLMKAKTMADWDRFFLLVQECDPYQHLRSVHNCRDFYDHGKPWVTHCSIQSSDLERVPEWRKLYRKPVVVDECKYEGNIEQRWGNISAQELVHRFWLGTIGGGYVGHGETYLHPQDILWWSKGGALRGQSPARIAFLRRILEEAAADGVAGLEPLSFWSAGQEGRYYLYYFGIYQPAKVTLNLPEDAAFQAEIINPWEMTTEPLPDKYRGKAELPLPGKPFLAARLRRLI